MSSSFDLLRAVRELPLPAPPPKLGATDKLVLIALALRANEDRVCWPSYRKLAEDAWLSSRSVKTSVRRLAQAGIVEVQSRRRSGGLSARDSNLYTIRVAVVKEVHQGKDIYHPVNGMLKVGEAASPPVVNHVHGSGEPRSLEVITEVLIASDQGSALEQSARETSTKKVRREKQETTAPESDAPCETVNAWCAMWNIPSPWDDEQAARFIDHARTNQRRCHDWGAAWRNWQRSAKLTPNTRHQVQLAPATGSAWKPGIGEGSDP